jgi:serine/threonine protein kinase
VVAYELLIGRASVRGQDECTSQLIAAHLSEAPVPLTQRNAALSASLSDLVLRCLEKDATHRPANADEVLQTLDGVATPSGTTGTRTSSSPAPTRSRRTTMFIAGGVLVMAAIVAVVVKRNGAGNANTDRRN